MKGDMDRRSESSKREHWFLRLNAWVYRRCMCVYPIGAPFASIERAAEIAAKRVTRLNEQRAQLEKEELHPSGNAIVVFNDDAGADNMLRDFESRLSSSMISKVLSPTFLHIFHVITGASPFSRHHCGCCCCLAASRMVCQW